MSGTNTTRALVTGISGSIGCHVFAHIMHNTDWHVIGIASFRHKGWSDRITHMFKEHPEWQERLTMFTHDLTAPISPIMAKRMGNVDYIINLASQSDVFDSIQNPVPFVKNNVDTILNMLELARELKPKTFIQFSTDEVYGPTSSKDERYPEWSTILPSNPYAASKASQEAIAISYWRTYNVPVVITNTMNNFGELQQPSKYPVMIQKAIGNGDVIIIHGEEGDLGSRSYIHSRNVADALLFILKLPAYLHEAGKVDRPDRYNIAGDKQLDNLELVQEIAKAMDEIPKYEFVASYTARPGHDKHYGLDDKKLKGLGWKSPHTFEESLKNVIQWQQENPDWLNTAERS